jgi:hypothetical protein
VNPILTKSGALVVAAVFTAGPAFVVLYYIWRRSSVPVVITLANQVIDLFTDVFYTCRSQYGSLLLLNLHLILLVSALVPYLCIVLLSGKALRAPERHGAYARLHIVLPQSKPLAVLAACWNGLAWVVVYLLVGPLLWKAEVLIMPAGWAWFVGDASGAAVVPEGDEAPEANAPPTFDPALYHVRVMSSWLLQALPMIVIQCLNNQELTRYSINAWDVTACISVAASAFACLCGLYTILRQLRRHGFRLRHWTVPSLESWSDLVQKSADPATGMDNFKPVEIARAVALRAMQDL